MSYTNAVIIQRTIRRPDNGNQDYYVLDLELSNFAPHSIGEGGDPGDFPHQAPVTPSVVQQVSGLGNIQLPNPVAEGDTLVYVAGFRGSSSANGWDYAAHGYTAVQAETDINGSSVVGMYYRLAGAGQSQYLGGDPPNLLPGGGAVGTLYELPGVWEPVASNDATSTGTLLAESGTIAAPAGSIAFGVVGYGRADGAYDSAADTFSFTPGTGWTEDLDSHASTGGPSVWTAHRIVTGAATVEAEATHSGVDAFYRFWGAEVAAFASEAVASAPAPGQWVYGETPAPAPDAATTTFSTVHAFADGSLRLTVDGIEQSTAVESYDGASGTFTMSWAPSAGERLSVSYQGR